MPRVIKGLSRLAPLLGAGERVDVCGWERELNHATVREALRYHKMTDLKKQYGWTMPTVKETLASKRVGFNISPSTRSDSIKSKMSFKSVSNKSSKTSLETDQNVTNTKRLTEAMMYKVLSEATQRRSTFLGHVIERTRSLRMRRLTTQEDIQYSNSGYDTRITPDGQIRM